MSASAGIGHRAFARAPLAALGGWCRNLYPQSPPNPPTEDHVNNALDTETHSSHKGNEPLADNAPAVFLVCVLVAAAFYYFDRLGRRPLRLWGAGGDYVRQRVGECLHLSRRDRQKLDSDSATHIVALTDNA